MGHNNIAVGVPEWLSGMTRNHVGSARAGSNPAAHVSIKLKFYFYFNFLKFSDEPKVLKDYGLKPRIISKPQIV